MPIPDFPPLDDFGVAARRDFVNWVRSTLECLVVQQEYGGLFVEGLQGHMTDAWADMGAHFDSLQVAVADLGAQETHRHGLTGPQIEFKLATVRYWASRFQNDGENQSFVLRRLLDAIDNLLETLLDATALGSALKEYKHAVRDSLET